VFGNKHGVNNDRRNASTRTNRIVSRMSRHEAENVHVEAEADWIEFHFEVNRFYYVLSIQPRNGIIGLWSDDEQEEIFRVE
jgi:hypothetical protein